MLSITKGKNKSTAFKGHSLKETALGWSAAGGEG